MGKDKKGKPVKLIVFPAKKDGKTFAVAFESGAQGYHGDIGVMVGVDLASKKLTGISIVEHTETPGLGARITEPNFTDSFKGKPLDKELGVGDINALSGATLSTKGVVAAVNQGPGHLGQVPRQNGAVGSGGHEHSQGIHQGALGDHPALPPGAGPLPHPGGHHLGRKRHGHGSGHHLRAGLLQPAGFAAEENHPQQGAHRGLHRDHRQLRGHRGADHAGLRLPAVPGPGHLHPPDRGQLHHPGPRRGLCRQERPGALHRRRPGGGHRLHHKPDRAGRLPRDPGQRHHLGRPPHVGQL